MATKPSIFDRYNIVSERDLTDAMQRMQTYLIAAAEEEAKRKPAEIARVQWSAQLAHSRKGRQIQSAPKLLQILVAGGIELQSGADTKQLVDSATCENGSTGTSGNFLLHFSYSSGAPERFPVCHPTETTLPWMRTLYPNLRSRISGCERIYKVFRKRVQMYSLGPRTPRSLGNHFVNARGTSEGFKIEYEAVSGKKYQTFITWEGEEMKTQFKKL